MVSSSHQLRCWFAPFTVLGWSQANNYIHMIDTVCSTQFANGTSKSNPDAAVSWNRGHQQLQLICFNTSSLKTFKSIWLIIKSPTTRSSTLRALQVCTVPAHDLSDICNKMRHLLYCIWEKWVGQTHFKFSEVLPCSQFSTVPHWANRPSNTWDR